MQLDKLHALADAVAAALPAARRGSLYTSRPGLDLFRAIRAIAPYDDLHAVVEDMEHDLEPEEELPGATLINRTANDAHWGRKL
jgi:hypothetical protein